jgi:nitroreductase
MMMIENLIRKNRSCRRFYQNHPLGTGMLKDLVNLARLSASGHNKQPLAYIVSGDPDINEEIFSCLGWAAHLKDWVGPEEGERPAGYIIILGDTQISGDFGVDHGIAAQSILLGARENSLAGCMIGTINRKRIRKIFDLGDRYDILLVIALGEPRETVVIEAVPPDGDTRYWRDEKNVHHVPKRDLKEIILQTR